MASVVLTFEIQSKLFVLMKLSGLNSPSMVMIIFAINNSHVAFPNNGEQRSLHKNISGRVNIRQFLPANVTVKLMGFCNGDGQSMKPSFSVA